MYKVILILDEFFLKYEGGLGTGGGGGGGQTDTPQKKLPSKSQALLGVNPNLCGSVLGGGGG